MQRGGTGVLRASASGRGVLVSPVCVSGGGLSRVPSGAQAVYWACSYMRPPPSRLNLFPEARIVCFCFVRERERDGAEGERVFSKVHAQRRAWPGAQSHDPKIVT